MADAPGPRSVKIGEDERGGWSSDRPRREGGPPRKRDVSVRCRVLKPSDRMRYSPGSLVLIVSGSSEERTRLIERVVEDRGAVLSLDHVRELIKGRVPEEEREARALELLDAAATKRLQANESVVLAADGLDPEQRERYALMAAELNRPRHLILLETALENVAEDDRAALNELRRALDAGELGAEGFQTALRLGGDAAAELKRILFRSPPRDE